MSIILFGSTGMLGEYIKKHLYNAYELICITRDEYDIYNDNYERLLDILTKIDNKRIIINCAGAIPQRNTNYKVYFKVNSWFPNILSKICNDIGIKLIHITTDCVYNGDTGKYLESSKHTETGVYGISKSLGEPKNACIIRTSIIGEENMNKKSFIEWLKSESGNKINGYCNHYWNGVTCYQLSKVIKHMLDRNLYWNGIRHIFTPKKYSKYDMCLIINSIYNLNITVTKISTTKIINRTLSTEYDEIINIPDLITQIKEQKYFLEDN